MNIKQLNLKKIDFKYLFTFLTKVYLFLIFLFARSFTGFELLGFRLGELMVGFSALILLFNVFFIPFINKTFALDNKNLHVVLVAIILLFVLNIFLNNSQFSNLFIYKTSTYIWSIGVIFVGYKYLEIFDFSIYKIDIFFSLIGLFTIYIFSTRGISENNQNLFLQFTDKFEYPKGSDLLLAFVFIFSIFAIKSNFSKSSLISLMLMSSLFLPLFLVKSRSGFISLLFFIILLFPRYIPLLKKFDKYLILSVVISAILFLISTSWVVSRDVSIDEEINDELKYAITSRYQTINDNVYESEVLKLKLFYFEDKRIFSSDGNLNWRLQIWQDVLRDASNLKNFFMGYGYEDIVPAMDSDQRYGQDKQNINVHNYFIHILSRGGMLHLLLLLLFYYFLSRIFNNNDKLNNFYIISIPLIFNSLFDPSMENAHYPIVYFILLGMILNKHILKNWET